MLKPFYPSKLIVPKLLLSLVVLLASCGLWAAEFEPVTHQLDVNLLPQSHSIEAKDVVSIKGTRGDVLRFSLHPALLIESTTRGVSLRKLENVSSDRSLCQGSWH